MIDVFFCSVPEPGLRGLMSTLCRARWYMEPDTNIHYLTPFGLKVANEEFQRFRRAWADQQAKSDVYVVTDDDCLLPAAPSLAAAASILRGHPEFALLSYCPVNADIFPWTPEGYQPFENNAVMEHVSTGGIRVCRKGAVTEWPEMLPGLRSYDAQHAEAVRKAGLRVGYMRDLKMNHLGCGRGYSQVARA